jgi:predicted dehydrogenase
VRLFFNTGLAPVWFMNLEQFGVGVVGTGIMGRRMLAALQQHPRFRVDAVFDPSADSRLQALGLAPEAVAVDSLAGLGGLLARPGVQCVYVASPPAAHLEAVQASLAAGRAVLCEKPLAADLPQALALQAAVRAAGRPFAVNFPFARAAAALQMAELLQSGRLGAPTAARITLRFAQWPRPWQAGAAAWLAGAAEGGFTREVLSHFVFLVQRLFGPAQVADVQLSRQPGQAETALAATLVFGAPGHGSLRVQIDAAVAGEVADHNRLDLCCPQGTLSLVDWSRLELDGQVLAPRSDSTPSTLDALVRQLEGAADHGLASVDEAVAVVRTIEALLV